MIKMKAKGELELDTGGPNLARKKNILDFVVTRLRNR